jgi:hypothetical protein
MKATNQIKISTESIPHTSGRRRIEDRAENCHMGWQ